VATQYLALLRGINVGGKNLVKMDELRAAMESLALDDVATYIASGNVQFRAPRRKREELAAEIEKTLTKRFGTELRVVLLTETQLRGVVKDAPRGLAGERYLADVVFIRKPLTAKQAFSLVQLREGVDRAWPGKGVFYFSRLAEKKSSSKFSKVASLPEYKNMTIRSWSTVTKLLALMEERSTG
jgi:uncharacterized protein (DUF1697 family)